MLPVIQTRRDTSVRGESSEGMGFELSGSREGVDSRKSGPRKAKITTMEGDHIRNAETARDRQSPGEK